MGVAPPAVPIERRFAEKYRVDPVTGCWLWTGSIRANGYSQFRYSKAKNGYGHRFSYEYFVGSIPDGQQLHHRCGNRACVNPEHLELVTPREHVLERDDTTARRNAAKTHCKRGHPLSGDNLYVSNSGRRVCRTCHRIARERWAGENAEKVRESSREYQRRVRAVYKEWREAQSPAE